MYGCACVARSHDSYLAVLSNACGATHQHHLRALVCRVLLQSHLHGRHHAATVGEGVLHVGLAVGLHSRRLVHHLALQSVNHYCLHLKRSALAAPDVHVSLLARRVFAEAYHGLERCVAILKVFAYVQRCAALVARSANDDASGTCHCSESLVGSRGAVVRTEVRAKTDVHNAGLAYALSIVEAVLYAVGDVHVARTEAHEDQLRLGRYAVVRRRAVAACGDTCHVRSVERRRYVIVDGAHLVVCDVLATVTELRGCFSAVGVLVPNACYACADTVRVGEVDVRILESAVYNAHYDALAGVCAQLGSSRVAVVNAGLLACGVEKHTHTCTYLHVLHFVECRYSLNSLKRQTHGEQTVGYDVAYFHAERLKSTDAVGGCVLFRRSNGDEGVNLLRCCRFHIFLRTHILKHQARTWRKLLCESRAAHEEQRCQ